MDAHQAATASTATSASEQNELEASDDDYVSSLHALPADELKLDNIMRSIYALFCKKFSDSHKLCATFIDDIKYINILIASPKLAEIFIDLNSPVQLNQEGAQQQQQPATGNVFNDGVFTVFTSPGQPAAGQQGNLNRQDMFQNLFTNLPLGGMIGQPNMMGQEQNERFFYTSLLGILLSNSPLPSYFTPKKALPNSPANLFMNIFQMASGAQSFEFFQNPTSKTADEISRTEMEIDDNLAKLREMITELFFSLLKSSGVVRVKTLKWIEACLFTFNGRSKIWANELMSLVGKGQSTHSDGLMMNLSAVLLNLSKPFACTDSVSLSQQAININAKMLKVDPGYMMYIHGKHHDAKCTESYHRYMELLHSEVVLVPPPENASPADPEMKLEEFQPNFITRCFFLTHKALHLGFRALHERYTNINQENSQMQRRLGEQGLSRLQVLTMARNTLR